MHTEEIPDIETPRLRLVSMSVEVLQFLNEMDYSAARKVASFFIPDDCRLSGHWVESAIRLTKADRSRQAWLMHRAIVRREDNRMIGNIRFHHHAPGEKPADYLGSGAELGYTVFPEARRRGYARESAVGMMEWAFREGGVSTFFLTISPANVPSLKLADSMGFRKVGEKMDDIDGLEYVMRAEIHEIHGKANAPGNTGGIEQ